MAYHIVRTAQVAALTLTFLLLYRSEHTQPRISVRLGVRSSGRSRQVPAQSTVTVGWSLPSSRFPAADSVHRRRDCPTWMKRFGATALHIPPRSAKTLSPDSQYLLASASHHGSQRTQPRPDDNRTRPLLQQRVFVRLKPYSDKGLGGELSFLSRNDQRQYRETRRFRGDFNYTQPPKTRGPRDGNRAEERARRQDFRTGFEDPGRQ